jgi:hypothetical protein
MKAWTFILKAMQVEFMWFKDSLQDGSTKQELSSECNAHYSTAVDGGSDNIHSTELHGDGLRNMEVQSSMALDHIRNLADASITEPFSL